MLHFSQVCAIVYAPCLDGMQAPHCPMALWLQDLRIKPGTLETSLRCSETLRNHMREFQQLESTRDAKHEGRDPLCFHQRATICGLGLVILRSHATSIQHSHSKQECGQRSDKVHLELIWGLRMSGRVASWALQVLVASFFGDLALRDPCRSSKTRIRLVTAQPGGPLKAAGCEKLSYPALLSIRRKWLRGSSQMILGKLLRLHVLAVAFVKHP